MGSHRTPRTKLEAVLITQGRMQLWLAQRVGCHPSEISDYVRGVHVPREPKRSQIARELDVTLTELGWEEHEAAA